MKTLRILTCSSIVLSCSLLAGVPPARAGVDVDFGASVRVGDRSGVFVSVSSRYFDHEKDVVTDWSRRYRNPDDLAVFLFLVQHSGMSPEAIHQLRHQGLSWWNVGLRAGVPNDAWFVAVDHDPGPPYGKAYGHWMRHRRNPNFAMVISDDDCRNLVAVRMVHDYYGVPADVAMHRRSGGRDVRALVVEEYDRRHGMSASVTDRHGRKAPSSQSREKH